MEEVLDSWVNFSKKYYPLIIVLAFIVAGFAYGQAKETRISTNYQGYFFQGTPGLQETRQFESDFVGERSAKILIEVDRDYVDDVLEGEVLEMTRDVVDMVSTVPGVFSISSVLDLGGTRDEILSSPMENRQKFLDRELRYSIIKVKLDVMEAPKNKQLVETLMTTVKKVEPVKGSMITVAGPVSFEYMFREAIRNGFAESLVVAAIMIMLVLFFVFRSPTTTLVVMIPVGIAVVVAFGLMNMINVPINFLTVLFGAIALGLGVDDSIHLIIRYYEEQKKGNEDALNTAFARMGRNTAFTSFTTMAAFVSMLFSGFRMVAEYGVMSFIAILFALLSVLFFLPSFLLLEEKIGRKEFDFSWINNAFGMKDVLTSSMKKLAGYAAEKPFAVVLFFLIAFVPMAYGISSIKPLTNMDMWMPENKPATRANNIIKDEFGDTDYDFILVKAEDVREERIMEAMRDISSGLRELPYAKDVTSITDYLDLTSYEKSDINAIPPEVQRQLMTSDFTQAVIILETDIEVDEGMVKEIDDLIEYTSMPGDAEVGQVGSAMLLSQIEPLMKKGQAKTTMISLVLVIILLFIMLPSVSGNLLALTPLLIAILFAMGTMGLMGIPSTPLTILLATIMLGLGIDFSIHFLARYNEELGRGKESKEALLISAGTVGEGIAITAITTIFGFLSLRSMAMPPVKDFGLITSIGLLYAMVFTPLLISAGITIKDMVGHRIELTVKDLHSHIEEKIIAKWWG